MKKNYIYFQHYFLSLFSVQSSKSTVDLDPDLNGLLDSVSKLKTPPKKSLSSPHLTFQSQSSFKKVIKPDPNFVSFDPDQDEDDEDEDEQHQVEFVTPPTFIRNNNVITINGHSLETPRRPRKSVQFQNSKDLISNAVPAAEKNTGILERRKTSLETVTVREKKTPAVSQHMQQLTNCNTSNRLSSAVESQLMTCVDWQQSTAGAADVQSTAGTRQQLPVAVRNQTAVIQQVPAESQQPLSLNRAVSQQLPSSNRHSTAAIKHSSSPRTAIILNPHSLNTKPKYVSKTFLTSSPSPVTSSNLVTSPNPNQQHYYSSMPYHNYYYPKQVCLIPVVPNNKNNPLRRRPSSAAAVPSNTSHYYWRRQLPRIPSHQLPTGFGEVSFVSN